MGRRVPHDEVRVTGRMEGGNIFTSANVDSLSDAYIHTVILMEWGGEQRGL